MSDLIRKHNPDLLSIIPCELKSNDDSLKVIELLRVKETGTEVAKEKMENVFNIISGNGYFFEKYSAIEKILQHGGIAKLMHLLYNKGMENNEEWVVNEFLTPIEKLQSLFRGMPLFKVEVVDARPNMQKEVGTRMNNMGRYDVFLHRNYAHNMI